MTLSRRQANFCAFSKDGASAYDLPRYAMDLKDTLNLPRTDFPMRANLVEREPQRLAHWEKNDLYGAIQRNNASGDVFLLHDGPPFTNGDVHIGTALNKILKDFILRFKSMQGFRTPYIPGWDCHGLPIEYKVSRQLQKEKKALTPVELREACAEFSRGFIETQRAQFKRLGILADWAAEYRTMNPKYEAEILRTFALFVEQGLVYRSKKPVYWSIPCETALAEAEIEYKDHTSPSVWVAFKVPAEAGQQAGLDPKAEVVIWTTTPWTLPANLAIAVHPDFEYVQVRHGERVFLVAQELAEDFISRAKLDGATVEAPIKGRQLEGVNARHPFIERASPLVLADYVTLESGTGCVHTAPGHGLDDYHTGLKYGLEIYSPIDDRGRYQDDGQIPASLVGITVLERNGKCPANDAVLEIIQGNGALVHHEAYHHQYPHCWRSKTPVVFRAMDQWFVALDKEGLRQRALDQIGAVRWVPEWGENRIKGAVESRPDWCISRQRQWGMPLPVFFRKSDGEPLLEASVIEAVADKVEAEGSNIWWEQTPAQLLSAIELSPEWSAEDLEKGVDTMDVWIDSGCSHRAVLKQVEHLAWPADVYLEGSDQHRGWFQSSLWTGVIADSRAPYKRVITHGFIVDENKRKISKSDGKPQTADGYVAQYGADILRLWIASQDYVNDIPVSDGILKNIAKTYRDIRNTLRYQISNLYDFDAARDALPLEELSAIDQWALHKTHALIGEATSAFEAFEFHRAYQLIANFCNTTLSAIYHDILKDRLYTYGSDWPERRSSQTAIHEIFRVLCRLVAPILTLTADEAWAYYQGNSDFAGNSIHEETWPAQDERWVHPMVTEEVDGLLKFRDRVNEKLEEARRAKAIGQSLDAQVLIEGSPGDATFELLEQYTESLSEIFIVSQVHLMPSSSAEKVSIEVRHADGMRCPRSWRWVPQLVSAGEFGDVSPRCREALLARKGSNLASGK
ncbi:MAG: isoleucine--tRNA ligase [Opitutales bacterium]